MFSSFGWPEALLVFGIIVLLFGATRLPKVGGALGQAIREFKKGKSGALKDEDEEESNNRDKKKITQG